MLPRSLQTLLASAIPLAFVACTSSPPVAAADAPSGVDLGGSGPVHPVTARAASPAGGGHEIAPSPGAAHLQPVHESHGGASATGTVNSVDVAARRVNVSHEVIPALGWPPMTMDFPVAPSVDLSTIKSGAKVDFTLKKGSDGMPVIDTIRPAGGGR